MDGLNGFFVHVSYFFKVTCIRTISKFPQIDETLLSKRDLSWRLVLRIERFFFSKTYYIVNISIFSTMIDKELKTKE
jgi:hypothetical protein